VNAPAKRVVARVLTENLTESDHELRGRQLGDFVLRECIGQGAFAAVYRCEQPLLGREAVIKVLHQRLRESEVVLQRFMREARLASRLSHPYAAHVYAFGVEPEDGLAWIAMEMVAGTSLEHWLKEQGPLALDVLVPFVEHVAEVVQDAHDHGIVHRDLKPSNVMMIEHAGRLFPKLLDFGIAKMIDEAVQPGFAEGSIEIDGDTIVSPGESANQSLTLANTTLGSPPYMSPEQWCDPLSVGPRSDLYSLAIMAYEALTGKQPFTGATIAAIGERHCNAEVPSLGAGFPAELDRVFQRALAKAPEDRPASALAFASELRAAAFPPHEAARSGSHGAVSSRRRRWLAGGAAAMVAGAAIYTLMAGAGGDHVVPLPLPPVTIVRTVEAAPLPVAAAVVTAAPAAVSVPVVVEIESTPRGAEVYRLPSEIKVGTTPWRAELTSEAGMQVFVVRKAGFVDQRVEVDLRTGGTRAVKLSRPVHRPASPQPTPEGTPGQLRRKGEPVDPFRTGGAS
jgi:tRNA A-37 threonylcarbamoyl transferase component Bud32